MDFIKRTFPLLFGIFLLSVLVRLPQLNRPLSQHHESGTATSLRIMQIWYDNGISKYHFNPVMTFNNPADKFINNNASASGRMLDKEGNYYYVSHPPFAYYFPYFFFKLLHVRPDVLPLQIINLCFHFISGLFIYFTVCLLSFNRARSLPYRSAIVAFAVYVFMPVTLWFQGNVYMSDTAFHLLFVIGVYIALKMIIRRKFYSPKYIFFYVAVLGLMLYTSWLGVFFAFGVLVYSLLHVRDIKGFNVLLWSTVIVTLVTVRLIVYQYSQISGLRAYIEEVISVYLAQGSVADTDSGLFHFMFSYLWYLKTLLYNYLLHYNVIYIALLLFVWLAFSRKKMKIVFSENGYRFIWLSVTPVVLMHVFFLNYSVHDFTALYASLFFSVLAGILYDKVKKSGAIPIRRMQIGMVVVILLLIVEFQLMNPNPSYAIFSQYDNYKTSGERVAKHSGKEEVIFISGEIPEAQEVFYANRNLKFMESDIMGLAFLNQRNLSKGLVFSNVVRFEDAVITKALEHERDLIIDSSQ